MDPTATTSSLGTLARFFPNIQPNGANKEAPKNAIAKVTPQTRASIILLGDLLDLMATVMSATFEPKSRNRKVAAKEREDEFYRCRELIRNNVVMDPEDDRRPLIVKATPEIDLKHSRPQYKGGKKINEGGELLGTAIRAWVRLPTMPGPVEAVPLVSEGVVWVIENEDGIYEAAGNFDSIIVKPFVKEGANEEDDFVGYHVFCPVELANPKLLAGLEDTLDEKMRPGYQHLPHPIGKPGTRKGIFKKTMEKKGRREGTTMIGKKWSKNVISAVGSQVPPHGTYIYRYTEGWTAFVAHFLGTLENVSLSDTVTVLDVAVEMDPWKVLGMECASTNPSIINARVEELLFADPDEDHPTLGYLIEVGVLKADDEIKVQINGIIDALQNAKDKAMSELDRLWSEVTGRFNTYPTVAELTVGDITPESIKEATEGENLLTAFIASTIGFFDWKIPVCVDLYHWLIGKAETAKPIVENPPVEQPANKPDVVRPVVKYDGKVSSCRPAFDCCELLNIQSKLPVDIHAELTMIQTHDVVHATLVLNEALKAKGKSEMTEADEEDVRKVMNKAKAALFTALTKLIAAIPATGEGNTSS